VKVYLDENMPPFAAQPLAQVYRAHHFCTPDDEDLRGVNDVVLLETLKERGFGAIVTRDRRQLRDPAERGALIRSGLRWIGVADKGLSGLEQVTVTVATLIAGLWFVFEHDAPEPTSYALKTIQHTQSQRVTIRPLRIA